MTGDPFRTLGLSYDADADDVRRAFRRAARETHPDRGGSAVAFHEARVAYDLLLRDLDAQRRHWRRAPPAQPDRRYAAGLDPAIYPTCPVRLGRRRDGRRVEEYLADRRPSGWRPGVMPPPGGTCRARFPARADTPAFGIWTVPLDARRFRCVFGPHDGRAEAS